MKIRRLLVCVLMTFLMCACSILSIRLPFTPIPITLQAFVCLVSGALLGGAYGALSMLIYLFFGILGLPVYADMNAGVRYFFGPTGGFLVGFMPCAFFSGRLTRRFYRYNSARFIQFAGIFTAMAISTVILYFFGASYFAIITESGVMKAYAFAVLPFIWPDLLKITTAAIVVTQLYLFTMIGDPSWRL